MSNVTRLSHFARVPEKQWKALQPRVTKLNIGYTEFITLMRSKELLAVVVQATHERVEGELAYGEVTHRSTGDYELIYRDEVTRKLERRTAYEIEAVTARVALENRLDLLSGRGLYVNPSLIGQVIKHGSIVSIAPHFEDGAHADARIKLPHQHQPFLRMLEMNGYSFNGPHIVGRPAQAPRRPTQQEQYQQAARAKDAPKFEW